MFRFKKFSISDDRSTMKVGTDAVLLGSWTQVPCSTSVNSSFADHAPLVLEVGCGSGVISLMLAQRAPYAKIIGIDIHEESVKQAQENLSISPFDNVSFHTADFLSLLDAASPLPHFRDFIGRFSVVVSNPPYHVESLLSPQMARAMARNEQFLPFADLVRTSSLLLQGGGHLQVVIPASARSEFQCCAEVSGLSLVRALIIKTTERKPARRVLLDFMKPCSEANFPTNQICVNEQEIVLMDSAGLRSTAYSELCKEYYL